MKKQEGGRTMLLSVLFSSTGPIILGFGLMSGRSATQIADFVRRSVEFLALVVAYVVFRITSGDKVFEEQKKAALEKRSNLFVGGAMCLSGVTMLLVNLLYEGSEKGNVTLALIIAMQGVLANGIFWRRYLALSRKSGNTILAVQSRLYRAKTLVDISVTAALAAVWLLPGSPVSAWLDRAGSAVVAAYLAWCGLRTIMEQKKA